MQYCGKVKEDIKMSRRNNNEVKTVMRTSNISPNTKRVGDGASPSKLI